MTETQRCERCGHELVALLRPMRRLRWSRYWLTGFKSLFTGSMRICHQCGAMYSNDGTLVAAGAIATDAERSLDVYRKDMAHLRNAFLGIMIAAGGLASWLAFGPETFELGRVMLIGALGGGAAIPTGYFARKSHVAGRELRSLRRARRAGQIPGKAQ